MTGKATAEGTRRYFERLKLTYSSYQSQSWIEKPPFLPLQISKLGIGTYRLHRDEIQHHEALREAFLSGMNIVDTSANHSDGAAEVLVGNVLRELIDSKRISRDELILVERAGFIEGSTLKLMSGRLPEDTVWLSTNLAHSLHPDFLAVQIDGSLQRLGVSTIDFFLLQNPEIQFKQDNQLLEILNQSFQFLEQERQQNRIQYYGISTNLLHENPAFIERLIHIAPDGFRLLEFAANIIETQYRDSGILSLAKKKSMYTMSCRSLSAVRNSKVLRLARLVDPPADGEDNPKAKQLRLEDELSSIEDRMVLLINKDQPRFNFDVRTPSVATLVAHYRQKEIGLDDILPLIDSLSVPIQKTATALSAAINTTDDNNDKTGRLLFERYLRLVHTTLAHLSSFLSFEHHERLSTFEMTLQKHSRLNIPLSLIATQSVLAEGVGTVFVGSRRPKAVQQMSRIFTRESFTKIQKIEESWLPNYFTR